jgi:ABC-type transport system substrate-binding protein
MRVGARARRISGSLLLVALVVVTACTDDDDPGPGTTTTRAAGEVVDGGTVRLGLSAPIQPDPALVNLGSPTDLLVADLLHDGLTRLDADGAPVPALAESWTADATFAIWVFTLDPEATFTSGRPVTSADVVASLERVARGGDTSLAALDLELIAGFRPFVDGAADHLAGLTAPDAATVQIVLNEPFSVLPYVLASPPFGIVDGASLDAVAVPEGESLDLADLADLDLAGSWRIGATTDESVTLERRPAVDGHLDAVELRTFDRGDAAYDAYDAGDVDWALVPADRYDDAVAAHGDDHVAAFHAELFFGQRVTSPILANVELRKAVAAAIDPEAIVEAVYPELADPLTTIIPVGVPGHDPDRCPDCGYDPERATTVLAAAFPDGNIPTVTIDFDESAHQRDMAELVAEELDAVGIPTTLRAKPLGEYKAFVVSGAQELFSFGWIGGYASPDAYLAPLFASAANDNLTGYGAAGVDAALVAARATSDPAAALVQWAAVERQVLTEAAVVPIAQFRTQAVVADRVEALEHAVDGSIDWSRVWVTDGV